jgi:hypothetical protein
MDVSPDWSISLVDQAPGFRVLTWAGETLYAARGYELFQGSVAESKLQWRRTATYNAPCWRKATSRVQLAARLVRDGFHALAVLPSHHLIAAVPGAIVTKSPHDREFRITHKVSRGTRPLHIAGTPSGHLFFGEYFDNAGREEVHIYGSSDHGNTWQVAHTFPKGTIRHVHNIVHDAFQNCLWICTGDYASECRIVRASCDLKTMDVVLQGNQQARTVAAVPAPVGLYFSSDTPLENNFAYLLEPRGTPTKIFPLASSSIYGCRVRDVIFFTTMVEPSSVNLTQQVCLYGGRSGTSWRSIASWKKDRWPARLFQYGNAFLPDGENRTNYLALTTVAVENGHLVTHIFRVESDSDVATNVQTVSPG